MIHAVGGGGGGGDAGYSGEIPKPDTNEHGGELSPLKITKEDLKKLGVSDTDDDSPALAELKGRLGHLWAFAEGADSGEAGDIYYTVATPEPLNDDITTCPKNFREYKEVNEEKTLNLNQSLCEGAGITGSEPTYEEIDVHYSAECDHYGTEEVTENYNESISDKAWGKYTNVESYINDESLTCSDVSATGNTVTFNYTSYVYDSCSYSENDIYKDVTYSLGSKSSDQPYGQGLFCTTSSEPGDLGLTINKSSDVPNEINVLRGGDINYGKDAVSPYSFCKGGMDYLCGPSIGGDYSGKIASASISRNNVVLDSVEATSASSGATGISLEKKCATFKIFKDITDKSRTYEEKTFCWDVPKENSSNSGDNGECNPGTQNGMYDCRKNIEGIKIQSSCREDNKFHKSNCTPNAPRAGYCLQHADTEPGDAEFNGNYKYTQTFYTNFLKKGLPGEPGKFKTIIVRSLNGISAAINIGRGGSPATLNRGGQGMTGSPTSFGDILVAEGGAGGKGNILESPSNLPPYDGSVMEFDSLKACLYTPNFSHAKCGQWKTAIENKQLEWYKNTSVQESLTPTQTFVGGMFSFVLSSFGAHNDDVVNDIISYAGKGGTGGGVEHFCWAGKFILNFDGEELKQSSVYNAEEAPSGVPGNHKIPAACYNAYQNIPAGAGYDGALIITW